MTKLTMDDAIAQLRQLPEYAALLRDAYLDRDVSAAAARFAASAEFAEARALMGDVDGKTLLEIGGGNGMAGGAWTSAGATVIAVEPDLGIEAGLRARGRPLSRRICAIGEQLPLRSRSVDIIYTRQVLHHCRDLRAFAAECARVLVDGGTMLACREHVVSNERELRSFLEQHPLHRLTGDEWAYPLAAYAEAFTAAGLRVERIVKPWDSVINAFPAVQRTDEIPHLGRAALQRRLGRAGTWLGRIGIIAAAAQRYVTRGIPGRMYTFVVRKPS